MENFVKVFRIIDNVNSDLQNCIISHSRVIQYPTTNDKISSSCYPVCTKKDNRMNLFFHFPKLHLPLPQIPAEVNK